tara:strand:- start:19177 stop:19593 length:417 start_codon:yes stop_codon:yes gene_type:complete
MKTGFTCGAFDLLHAGHILMLEEAKSFCDYLIVGLHSDPTIDRSEKNRPIQSLDERLIQLRAVKFVDLIVIYDTELDLINLLKAIRPNLRVIGADYIDKSFTGDDLGIEVKFNSRNHSFSSSGLRKRIQSAENLKETK